MRRLLFTALLALTATSAIAQPTTKPAAQTQEQLIACLKRYDPMGLPRHMGDAAFAEQSRPAICREGYALSFNKVTRNPDWVIERITPAMIVGDANRKNNFKTDPAATNSPTDKDYAGSGYDQGHQAPAADFKYSQPATDQSFYMSNMSPQVGLGFNRSEWARLEGLVRDWGKCAGRDDIIIVTGPIYGDSRAKIGPNADIAVPKAYYKIAYDVRSRRAVGFRLENEAHKTGDLFRHIESIREIETATGLDFFTALPKRRQNQLEIPKGVAWGHDFCS